MTRLVTDRLILRPFEPRDLDAFAAINADPVVMEHFPATQSRHETEALMQRFAEKYVRDGYAMGAVERRADGAMIGMAGLNLFAVDLDWCPMPEVGWRFAPAAWGQGYASEAARAWLDHGFTTLGMGRIVAFTATSNSRSERVMQRIGMTRAAELDFDHPKIDAGHPLRAHIVYCARPR